MTEEQKLIAQLLHDRNCPVGGKCLAQDCVECVKLHTEGGVGK